MYGEFTAYCNHYYLLTEVLAKREHRLENFLINAPLYCGQTNLTEIDAIISYYREAQAMKAKVDKTWDDIRATERIILMIMRHFDIPPRTILTGEIPGELQYELWANEHDTLYISKIKNLQPETDNPNVFFIKLWNANREED